MEENTYIVYVHINKINGKKYVGLTKHGNNPNKRWRNGKHYEGTYFGRAINKYGWDNFEHIILEKELTLEQANQKEKYYIELYNSNNENFGYNLTSGGDSKFTFSKSTLQKISKASKERKRRPFTQEERDLISEKTKEAMNEPERRARMLEIYKSEDWLKKNSESAKKQWANTNLKERVQQANGKSIKCVETGVVYPSAMEAARHCNMSRYQITRSAKGGHLSTYEFHWEYV